MFKNFLKVAIRNIFRHKLFSFLNVLGLALGLASSILIILWVNDELSYDQFHENAGRIFRVSEKQNINNNSQHLATTSGPLSSAIENDIPGIENTVRIWPKKKALLSVNDKNFYEEKILYTESSFFDIFSFKLLKGNRANILSNSNSIVLTEDLAFKYFGSANPIGKIVTLNKKGSLVVTGVTRVPAQSHLKFSCLISMANLNNPAWMKNWGVRGVYTYALLKPGFDLKTTDKNLSTIVKKYFGPEYQKIVDYQFQSVKDIHLQSHLLSELEPNGNINTVYIFLLVASAIMLLAIFNFINLSTAQSLTRLKEIGLRKTLGALKRQVFIQFLAESILLTSLSFFIAILLVEVSLPYLNVFLDKRLAFLFSEGTTLGIYIPGLLVVIAIVSGIVAPVKLSLYKPVDAMLNKIKREGDGLRKSLTVAQFVISISLVIVTLIVFKQFNYIQNKDLGYNRDLLINIKGIELTPYKGKTQLLKQEFLRLPEVASGTASGLELGEEFDVSEVRLENTSADNLIFSVASIDHDYLNTLHIPLTAGRSFLSNSPSDTSNAFIINETGAKKLGFKSSEEAINKKLLFLADGSVQRIVGVVKDFHITSLHQEINPVLFLYSAKYSNKLCLKIKSGDISETIASLERSWKKHVPGFPFEYSFADEGLENLYQNDNKIKQLLAFFSSLAVFIACLGLFGIATHSIEYKTKEIGIRKVMGASINSLLLLLSKDFLLLIFISLIIASPIAWYLSHLWLSNYAFRTSISVTIFPIAGFLIMFIALITTSVLIAKAALKNPVATLRQ